MPVQIAMLHPSEPAPAETSRKIEIDTTAFRRQIRYALQSLGSMRPFEAYWHVGEVVDEIYELGRSPLFSLANCDPQ